MRRFISWLVSLSLLLAVHVASGNEPRVKVRFGHFPNLTHAQGVIAHGLARAGRGWFEERLGPEVEVLWFTYNAGPSAVEAIFAGSLDVSYIGPSPTLNAHFRSYGEEMRVIGGAINGGAALLLRAGSPVQRPSDFRGKRIVTPQLGNSQDVSARAWLRAHGLKVTLTGGDTLVVPTANPDQLGLMKQGKVEGAWTVEPWVTRLEQEAGARVFFEETDVITTWLVARTEFERNHPGLVRQIAEANRELTRWIQANETEARRILIAELKEETRTDFSPELIAQAWRRLRFTEEVSAELLEKSVRDANAVGLVRGQTDTSRLLVRP